MSLKKYYVNKNSQSNWDHEVHAEGCNYIPDVGNRLFLGLFDNCTAAVKKAKEYYPQSNGCYYCSNECHTQ